MNIGDIVAMYEERCGHLEAEIGRLREQLRLATIYQGDGRAADDVRGDGILVMRWLLNRADSYWRDADAFAGEGDAPMSAAYRAIADELRRCVVEVGRPEMCFVLTEDNGSFCGWPLPCERHIDGDLDAWGRSRENADYGQEPPEGSTRWIYWHEHIDGSQ